jgi:hypothetical protein
MRGILGPRMDETIEAAENFIIRGFIVCTPRQTL